MTVHIPAFFRQFYVSLLLLLAMSAFFPVDARQEGTLSPALENPGHEDKPAWFKVTFLDLFEDIGEAAREHKRVLLFFYQDGCPYCKKLLQDNFGQRRIAEKTQKYFNVMAINIWGDREVTVGDQVYTEKEFARALKVQYTPTLLFFNKKHKAVFRADGYYPPEKFNVVLDYVGQHKETQLSFQYYLAKVSPEAASGSLHTALTNVVDRGNLQQSLDKNKYLLVMFEQKQCAACDELHQDILQRDTSKKLLKHFNIIVLDRWSNQQIITPDGRRMKISDWASSAAINYVPAMLYFDDKGREVFRSDAYLKAFHIQSVMDYVASGSYQTQPDFQRYVDARARQLRKQGIKINIME